MLFCCNCGQSKHISESLFEGYEYVSGTEQVFLDPETGETVEWGGPEISERDDAGDITCPECSSSDIDINSGHTDEEARIVRDAYEIRRKDARLRIQAEREKVTKEEEIRKNGWDV